MDTYSEYDLHFLTEKLWPALQSEGSYTLEIPCEIASDQRTHFIAKEDVRMDT